MIIASEGNCNGVYVLSNDVLNFLLSIIYFALKCSVISFSPINMAPSMTADLLPRGDHIAQGRAI